MLALTPDTESVGSWSHPLYSRSPPCSPLAGLPGLCFGIPPGGGGGFPSEYSLSRIPRAGSSLLPLLDSSLCFKTHPWSEPQVALNNVTLHAGFASWRCPRQVQAPVHSTTSRIHPQKFWFSTPSDSDRFAITSPFHALSSHRGLCERITEV